MNLDDAQLAILILNYNSSGKVIAQLNGFLSEGINPASLYVIDNRSSDAEALRAHCIAANIPFIPSPINGGYAYGNNIGIRRAITENKRYFLILNPDIEITRESISRLLRSLLSHPCLGVIGPRILDKAKREIIFSDGGLLFRDQGFRGDHVNYMEKAAERPSFGLNFDIDYVNGSAMLFSLDALSATGFMREDFFMYYEESEWCMRVKHQTPFQIAVDTNIIAFHEDSHKGSLYEYYMTRNQIWMTRMYGGNKFYLARRNLGAIRRSLKKRQFHISAAVIHGWCATGLRKAASPKTNIT